MTNVLAFRRPSAPAGFAASLPCSCDVLRFTPRPAARSRRLIAEWRFGDHSGRLECHWLPENGEAGGKDGSRRWGIAPRETARRRTERRLASGAGAALLIDRADRSTAEVP